MLSLGRDRYLPEFTQPIAEWLARAEKAQELKKAVRERQVQNTLYNPTRALHGTRIAWNL